VKALKPISYLKKILTCLALPAFMYFSAASQCIPPYSTITYDTLIIGSGNDYHSIALSQFDPSIGTLMGVDVSSVVSVNYGFTLKNTNTIPINFSISVGRNDNIQSTVLTSDYSNSIVANVGTFALNPNQTITQAPVTVINRYDNNIHLTNNLVNFMGSSTVGFDYSPQTYTDHSGSSIYQYSASANDTIHFSITYSYCSNILLKPAINSFTAKKIGTNEAGLTWSIVNEQKNRTYQIERSVDQSYFSGVGTITSVENAPESDYSFNYLRQKDEKLKLYFRLKIIEANASISYSEIKMVDLGEGTGGIRLYPNPSDRFINLVFNQSDVKNWQVDIIGATGSLLQRNLFINTSMAHIDFVKPLAAGVYFIRAVDQQTQQSHVLSFTVR